jgi:hypothetical protein
MIFQKFKKSFAFISLKNENENLKKTLDETRASFDNEVEQRANLKFAEKMAEYYYRNWLINPKQVFTIGPSGIPYVGFEPITKSKATELQSEAKLLQSMNLWEVFQQTIKQEAIKKSVYESTEFNHVLPGKMMIHNLGLLQAILKSILSIDIEKIPEASGTPGEKSL